MKMGNEIVDELRDLGSNLADVPRIMPYTVPHGYFENFASSLSNTITTLEEKEQHPGWSKKMPFALPDGYFGGLPAEIATAASFSALPKTMPLSAPAGYFEHLPARMLQAAKAVDEPVTKGRTIALKGSALFRQIRWAAAAVLVVGLGIGSYQFYTQNRQPASENLLASVPSNDIREYVQRTYRMDAEKVVSNEQINDLQLDNKDIIQYLNETGWD